MFTQKKSFQLFNLVTCAILTLSVISSTLTYSSAEASAQANPSASKTANLTYTPSTYVNLLGKGIDVDWSKTKEGKQLYKSQIVKDFKAAGISHVRIRIANMVTEDLLIGLDQQIQDCLQYGLIPIVAFQADSFKNNPTDEELNQVVQWWSVLANRYKNTSHLLSFDLLIEATDAINKDSDPINKLFESCVTEIRKTNPTRILFMSPRLRADPQYLNELKLPSHHNGYMMAEWHFYASGPSKTNPLKLWTTGTQTEKEIILKKIDTAVAWQNKTGIKTWVGAWMPGNYNDENDYTIPEQVAFARFVTESLEAHHIPFAVNSDTKFYDREKNEWIQSMSPVFKAIFSKSIAAGFNVKATLSTTQQCAYLESELARLKKIGLKTESIVLRLNGGTISQKTKPSDWSNDMMQSWAKLQKNYGCSMIFVVNFNDSPSSQKSFYSRLTQAGIKFSHIELGNEHYLNKFASKFSGTADEVTQKTANMTPAKYIQLSNEYISVFKALKLPFLVQFSPLKDNQGNSANWNKIVSEAVNQKKFNSEKLIGTIHLYERTKNSLIDVTQIKSIRSLVKVPMPIAITEFGVVDDKNTLTYAQYIQQEAALTKRLLAELKSGDLLLNQVLYTDYKTAEPEVLHESYKGVTPKGSSIIDLFSQFWR